MAAPIRLNVNGATRLVEAAPGSSLLSLLRDDLGLTGAHYGCGHGACGACYVLIDRRAVPACVTSVEHAAGKEIVTVEGLAQGDVLHPVQQAFLEEDAMQCGACTSGMVIATVALLEHTPHPDEDEIRAALAPHLCRCGIYGRVIRAVKRAAR
ncbi:(2Fe-2S)-binding protein [Bradyrhizobium sp. dw_78]|uniref:(2Fe-2S)-binding protein n=1 Tax=Bradyrhizobium sp. dw_78 TaxID=2719793 RepID=UPI001BD615F2|nr:(2Fe-2S)-binding protein [Bradyrhizobium sp. dw_78]